MPSRLPSRVRMFCSSAWVAMDLSPMGPDGHGDGPVVSDADRAIGGLGAAARGRPVLLIVEEVNRRLNLPAGVTRHSASLRPPWSDEWAGERPYR